MNVTMMMRMLGLPRCAALAGHRAHAARRLSSSSAGAAGRESFYQSNWLDEDCGDVPMAPRALDLGTSEMLRGGLALQVASANLIAGQLAGAARGGPTAFSQSHVETLKSLSELEKRSIERLEATVRAEGLRFRPSLTLPAVHCGSRLVGGALSWFGEDVSAAYMAGVKLAIGDYYNDQIREIYEGKLDEHELKELFKVTRDEELAFVDEVMPDAADQYQDSSLSVATVARTTTKVLLEVAKVV